MTASWEALFQHIENTRLNIFIYKVGPGLGHRQNCQTTLLSGNHVGGLTETPGGDGGCHVGHIPPSAWNGRRVPGTASSGGPGRAPGSPASDPPGRLPSVTQAPRGGCEGTSCWLFTGEEPGGPSWGQRPTDPPPRVGHLMSRPFHSQHGGGVHPCFPRKGLGHSRSSMRVPQMNPK